MATSRIDAFKQMLSGDPDNANVRFGLANEYLKAEQYQEAVEELERYLQLADDEGAAYGMLARALEQLGQRSRAREAYEQGITAAEAHNHPTMAGEYRMTLETEYED
ncbi:MAG: tetratricopeptide repeat protein [Pyrinomonadaceae bacterium]|nr:tetratricopeptide repeat protein [Pyrinomonadaceae bacterium]